MKQTLAFASLALLANVYAQQAGTLTAENHPSMPWKQCTKSGCKSQTGSVVLDANWRWVHSTDGSTNCYTVCVSFVACLALSNQMAGSNLGLKPLPRPKNLRQKLCPGRRRLRRHVWHSSLGRICRPHARYGLQCWVEGLSHGTRRRGLQDVPSEESRVRL